MRRAAAPVPVDKRRHYVVGVAATRVIVLAHNQDEAFRMFVADKFPIGQGGGRVAPPARKDSVVRRATDLEVEELTRSSRRKRLQQESALFDASDYDKSRHSGVRL